MKDVSLNATFLIACISETLVYGIAFTLFALASKFIVTQRRTREGLSKPLAFSLPLLFIFATLHLGGTWARTFKGFVNENGKSDVFWTIVTSAEQSVTQVGQVGAIVLGDGMIVYRTHMVWSKGLTVIIAPCIALLATIVAGVGVLTSHHMRSETGSEHQEIVRKWTLAFLASSLITTLTCTVFIIYKLRSIRPFTWDRAATPTRNTAHEIWRGIVGSAFIYSFCTFFYLILYAARQHAAIWFSGAEASVASICFSLITMRIEWATRESNAVTFTFPDNQLTTKWTDGTLSIISPRKNEFTISSPPVGRKMNLNRKSYTKSRVILPATVTRTGGKSKHTLDLEKGLQTASTATAVQEQEQPRVTEIVLDISPTAAAALVGYLPDAPLSPYGPDRIVPSDASRSSR